MKSVSSKIELRNIHKDWCSLYPYYAGYKTNIIAKRFDILVVGIALDYGFSSKESYTPTFFVSNILDIPAALAFSFSERCHEPNGPEIWIKVSEHSTAYREAATLIHNQFGRFLVDEKLELAQVKDLFQSDTKADVTNTLKCLALLCAFGGQKDDTEKYITKAVQILKTFDTVSCGYVMGWYDVKTLPEWEAKLRKECSDIGEIQQAIERKVVEYKLEKIPNSPLIID